MENVYEKLEREKLGFLIAKLGNQEKREGFFTKTVNDRNGVESELVEKDEINKLFKYVERYISDKNKMAQLENLLREIKIEKEYLKEWRKNHPEITIDYIKNMI